MWVNRMDIEQYVGEFKGDPVLGPAARYLQGYQELVDDISDGWSTWMTGTRCATDLMTLLEKAHKQQYNHWNDPTFQPTRRDVEKAVAKIERFIKSEKVKEGIAYATNFLKHSPQLPVLETAVQLALL